MNLPSQNQQDPAVWTGVLSCAFLLLVLLNIAVPTRLYFDEVHYVPAARVMLEFDHITNREHPLLGKELIALGITLFGDNPMGWRSFPALAGAIALFAFTRAMWFATLSRFATLGGGVLVATGFVLFVHSRIAILDVFMICFVLVGIWMCSAAMRHPGEARWRLAIGGISLGLALGCKWNAAPVVALPGLVFLVMKLRVNGLRFLTAPEGGPVPGMSLLEAGIWLGLLPFVAYLATFWPVFFYAKDPLTIGGYWEYHKQMLEMQQQTIKPHPYMSRWYQWVINWRPVWYLYENIDGAQRGVLMLGNPLTMLIGLPAVLWCAWAGIFRKHKAALGVTLLYAVTLGMWIVAPKPIQFYYHYFLPGIILLAALALALDALRQAGWKKTAWGTLVASIAVFALFYPILSATPLSGRYSYENWMFLDSWR